MVLQVLADARQVVHDRDAELRAARAAGPMPESFRSWGELIAPAARITSRRARAVDRPAAPRR